MKKLSFQQRKRTPRSQIVHLGSKSAEIQRKLFEASKAGSITSEILSRIAQEQGVSRQLVHQQKALMEEWKVLKKTRLPRNRGFSQKSIKAMQAVKAGKETISAIARRLKMRINTVQNIASRMRERGEIFELAYKPVNRTAERRALRKAGLVEIQRSPSAALAKIGKKFKTSPSALSRILYKMRKK